MHELSFATAVFDKVSNVAEQKKSKKINKIELVVGTSSAIVEEALIAAFDALKSLDEYKLYKACQITIEQQDSKSICLKCGHKYTHGFGAAQCPKCKSYNTQLIEGSDIYIKQIEVEN